MNRGAVIDLNRLNEARRGEIHLMEQGIRGDADSVLWTSELRATNRGGKPCGLTRVEEK